MAHVVTNPKNRKAPETKSEVLQSAKHLYGQIPTTIKPVNGLAFTGFAASKMKIGVLGGGQLGRMLAEASVLLSDLGISTWTLDSAGSSASKISGGRNHFVGSFKNAADIERFAQQVDVLTIEIEHVDTAVLEKVSESRPIPVQPGWKTLRTIQDKYEQKTVLRSRDIELGPFAAVEEASVAGVLRTASALGGLPIMLKARTDAYDGRGNFVVHSENDVEAGIKFLGNRRLYAEKLLHFQMELAVMVVKTEESETSAEWEAATKAYPVVETVHKDSICQLTYCPPRCVPKKVTDQARILARRAVAAFRGRGVFGVEMFLLKDDRLLVNEIAPRVHNSGHWTLNAARTSQFTAHLLAVAGKRIDAAQLEATSPSIMLNVLGGAEAESHLELERMARGVPGAHVYDYEKGKGTPGRKMGHIVLTAPTMQEAEANLQPLLELAERIRREANAAKARAASGGRSSSSGVAPRPDSAASTPFLPPTAAQLKSGIAVTMGSTSDLPVLKPGLQYLASLGLTPYVTVTSAHRTPDALAAFGKALAGWGFKVAIAAAGGAAHLPGMLAAFTTLPVIGVPVKPSIGDGTDSLLSIANMPRGCAVACVGVNNSTNAAQLAVRMLAAFDPELAERFARKMDEQKTAVEAAARQLERTGWEHFAA